MKYTKHTLVKKTISAVFSVCFLFLFASAQTQSRLWSIPPKTVTFPAPTTPPLPISGSGYDGITTSNFANNAMHDPNGNLLFFINDGIVYDRNGVLIGQIVTPSIGFIAGTTEWTIVPVPGGCTKYYLIGGFYDFLSSTAGAFPQPYYIILDLSLINSTTNAHGDFIGADVNNNQYQGSSTAFPLIDPQLQSTLGYTLAISHASNMHFAVTPLRAPSVLYPDPNGSRFLYINNLIGGCFDRFLITSTGISYETNFLFSGGNTNLFGTARAEMEIVKISDISDPHFGNYRLALPYQTDGPTGNNRVLVVDLDFATGNIIPSIPAFPNPKYIALPTVLSPAGELNRAEAHGIEFSADGKYLYVTHTQAPYVEFANLSVVTPTFAALQSIPTIAATLLSPQDFQYSQIELGNDGWLYFAGNNIANTNPRLAALDLASFPVGSPIGKTWSDLRVPNVIVPISTGTFDVYNAPGQPSQDVFQLRLLNDQVDGEIYQNIPTSSPVSSCCTINTVFTKDNYSADPALGTSQIWQPGSNPFTNIIGNGNTVTIRDQLIIPPGMKVEIRNMTFKFAPRTYVNNIATAGASVEVRRSASSSTGTGGRLTLSNTVFTSYDDCGLGMWEGVEVHGYSGIVQGTFVNSQQGWLRMINFSVIANAWRGAVTGDVTNPLPALIPTVIANSSGGIIQGATSTFKNNRVSVMFLAYNFPTASIDNNASYFDKCVFETSSALNDINAVAPFAQAVLWNTKGILFRGNTFSTDISTSPYTQALGNTGMGIWAIRSAFKVLSFPITPNIGQRSVFSNLTYGVAISNSFSTKTVTIDRADFRNNFRGVFLNVVNIATITQNNFEVYRSLVSTSQAYGLYCNYSSGFQIEQNDFSYSDAASPVAYAYGIIVNQSNPARSCGLYDEIYRNTFHSINYGIQIYGNNSELKGCAYAGAPNNTGLVMKCNKFYSNVDSYDIRVADFVFFNQTVSGNIAYQQGNCSLGNTAPANDQYSSTHNFATSNFAIDGTFTNLNPNTIQYTWSANSVTLPLVPVNYTAPVPFSGVNLSGCSAYTYSDLASCPSNVGIIQANASSQKQAIVNSQQQINTINTTIANGDAANLYSVISSGNPCQIQNTLLAQSPNLSDGVILAAINQNLPSDTLKNIILANSPVSQDVMNALNAISLPNGIRNQINAAQTGVSARSQLLELLSAYQAEKSKFVNDLLRIYLNDSTLANGVDSVLFTYKIYQIPEYRCEIVKGYLDKKDTTAAKVMIDSLRTLGGEDNFCLLAEVLIKLDRVGQDCFGIANDPSLTLDVMAVAADGSKRVCADANSLLQLVFQYQFNEYFDNPTNQNARLANNQENEATSPMGFRMYPNPSSGLVQLDYSIADNETGVFLIFNSTGSLVISQILTQESTKLSIQTDLPSGVYFCMVSVNGEMKFAEKLVIVR